MDRWSAVTALAAREAAHSKSFRNGRILFFCMAALLPGGLICMAVISGNAILFFEPMRVDATDRLLNSIVMLIAASIALYGFVVGGAALQRIALERRQNSWTLFRLAPIGGMEMAVAQWLASLVPMAIWIGMHVPIVALLITLQSPSLRIWTAALLTLVIACCMAVCAINVMAAAAIKVQRPAAIFTGFLAFLWGIGFYIIATIVIGGNESLYNDSAAQQMVAILATLSPVLQFQLLAGGTVAPLEFGICLAGLLFIIAASLGMAAWLFKRENPFAAIEKRAPGVRTGYVERIRKALIPRRRPIHERLNPFFVQELRRSYLGYPLLALIYLLLPTAAFFGLTLSIAGETGSVYAAFSVWLMLVISALLLMGPMFAGPMIARERDTDTFELITLTGRTPSEILRGKYWGAMASLFPFVAIAASSYLPIWLEGGRHYALIAASFATVTVCLMLQQSAGLSASVLSRNARDASSLSFYLSIGLLVGGPILLIFIRGLAFDLQTALNTAYAPLSFTSPLFALGYFIVMDADRMRGIYLVLTLWLFGGLAWWMFRWTARLLQRQMAGAGRYSNRNRTVSD